MEISIFKIQIHLFHKDSSYGFTFEISINVYHKRQGESKMATFYDAAHTFKNVTKCQEILERNFVSSIIKKCL